jgi:hypothetical protein
MKISFDYDDTLSTKPVQEYAAKLIEKGIKPIIVTARYSDEAKYRHKYSKSNSDLYRTANKLGIAKSDINFTNKEWKGTKLPGYGVDVHFENDPSEILNIKGTGVKTIDVTKPNWQKEADKILGL